MLNKQTNKQTNREYLPIYILACLGLCTCHSLSLKSTQFVPLPTASLCSNVTFLVKSSLATLFKIATSTLAHIPYSILFHNLFFVVTLTWYIPYSLLFFYFLFFFLNWKRAEEKGFFF